MAIETLGAALQQINRLFAEGAVAQLPDGQLLERFLTQEDAGAFETLMGRHGPMVLSVCRGILRDTRDAEDAFQATFLVLVKKGGTIRGRDTLGGWLYQVAHRVAIQANAAAARRRTHERQAGQMAVATSMDGPAASDDLRPVLHGEIARLPEKYRLAIVLCDLEGLPQVQAAGQLHWSERTLRHRLAEGRARLKRRLARRGLAPEGTTLTAVFLREARTVVPSAWCESTVRAALVTVHHAATAGAISTATYKLTEEMLKVMLLQKLKLASATLLGAGLLAWGASAALISREDEPPKATSTPGGVVPRISTPSASNPTLHPGALDAVGKFPVRGQVLDPDGKAVANADIFVRPHYEFGWTPISPARSGQKGRVTVSDTNGRFQFELDKASSDWPYGDEPAWHQAMIAAIAPGYGLAWTEAGSLAAGGDATLRLVKDDVPIRGRVLDTQGRPIAGVTVRLGRVRAVKDGVDLDAMLASGQVDEAQISATYGYDDVVWPGGQNTWTSDADGRFEIRGIGRNRLGLLEFHGPALADGVLYVMARPTKVPPRSGPRPNQAPHLSFHPRLVGATFEHVAGPTKPVVGVVRMKETGKPVAGVLVHGYESTTKITTVSARTDAAGRFRLEGISKGERYQIYAWARSGIDPFLGRRISVSDTEGLKPIETVLELPKGVIVIGRLVDEATGQTAPAGESHSIKLPSNPSDEGDREVIKSGRLSLTDPTFRLTVPPGEQMFYAAPRGRETPYTRARLRKADKGKGVGGIGDGETYEIPLEVFNTYKIVNIPETTEPFTVELKLIRGFRRSGRVVGPDGQPITGAYCYGLSATGLNAKKLEGGTFEVLGLEPGYPRQLVFAHPNSRLVGSVIIKGEDIKKDAPIEIRLARAGTVKGRLIDEEGLPLPGIKLSILSSGLYDRGFPSDNLWPDGSTFTTDGDGRFQITGLKPDTKSNIVFENPIVANYRRDAGEVLFNLTLQQPGEVRDLGDIKVKLVPQ